MGYNVILKKSKPVLIDTLKAETVYFGEDATIVLLRNAFKSVMGENKNTTIATSLAKTIKADEEPTNEIMNMYS